MTIVKISKDCLITQDQDTITLNLSDNYLKENQQLLLQQTENSQIKNQELTEEDNPWLKYAGMYENNPLFDEVLDDIKKYRQQIDLQTDFEEI